MPERFLVFHTPQYEYFARGLCSHEGFSPGEIERITFPDGENYKRSSDYVRGRNVILVGGTVDDSETLELFDIACGLIYDGADTLMMIVPYFGYSTMERAVKPGEFVIAKNRALLLSAIPRARRCNEILLVDLHTAGTVHYFEGHLRPYHLYTKRLMMKLISSFEDFDNVVLASTDAGRAKWVENLAEALDVPAAFAYKKRVSGDETKIRGINADVAGRHVVIYDDMIRTGGSLINAGEAYKEAGATKLTALAGHGVLPGDAIGKIERSGLFEQVITTDTHPHAVALAKTNSFLKIRSVIPDIGDFLRNREAYGAAAFLDT